MGHEKTLEPVNALMIRKPCRELSVVVKRMILLMQRCSTANQQTRRAWHCCHDSSPQPTGAAVDCQYGWHTNTSYRQG